MTANETRATVRSEMKRLDKGKHDPVYRCRICGCVIKKGFYHLRTGKHPSEDLYTICVRCYDADEMPEEKADLYERLNCRTIQGPINPSVVLSIVHSVKDEIARLKKLNHPPGVCRSCGQSLGNDYLSLLRDGHAVRNYKICQTCYNRISPGKVAVKLYDWRDVFAGIRRINKPTGGTRDPSTTRGRLRRK